MTVKELLEVCPSCDLVEIVIRAEGSGKWIQGFRIGKDAAVFPAEITKEVIEKLRLERNHRGTAYLEEGEEIEFRKLGAQLPMKVICQDVKKLPEHIANLRVCWAQPRTIPRLHPDPLTDNRFSFDISCFPDGYEEPEEEGKKDTQLVGQMSLADIVGGER